MKNYYGLFLLVFSASFSQAPADFISAAAKVDINPIKRNVVGSVTYKFTINDKKPDTIRIDAVKMEFTNVRLNGSKIQFKNNQKQLLLYNGFRKGDNTLTFDYEAFPVQAMYFVNWDITNDANTPEKINGQVWTQGQGKETSHWLPSFNDVNEKVIFNIDVTFEKSFTVISNGILLKQVRNAENITWQYRMEKPISSYLLMIAIGHYDKKEMRSDSGIPLEMYYDPEDAPKAGPTYKYSKEIFDFMVCEIGVPYPWEIYRQVPVHDFLYAGMENASSTIFSRDFVLDETGANDHPYQNVNAHELAHQWFGDLVTAQSGKHHWLQEGFATYYALLAEREIYGDDYFYNRLYNSARQIEDAAKNDSIPILNGKASSLSFYQKGAWALHVIRENIGREKFNLAVRNYLQKYQYKNVTTENFLAEVKAVSNFDTDGFMKRWLESSVFQKEEAYGLLIKNKLMETYLHLRDQPLSLAKDHEEILRIMKSDVYYPVKELLVYQSVSHPFDLKKELLSAALKTNDLQVRQAVAASLKEIPESFRGQYETLLSDKSYETQEIALFNLWKQFPQYRERYVKMSENWTGFQDKNLKLEHLSLAVATETSQTQKLKIYRELVSYTGTNYDSGVQQSALEKLLDLEFYTEEVFRSLAYGLGSHRWQFVKFSRDNIRKLIKDNKNRQIFIGFRSKLPIREKTQLQRLLEE